MDVHEVCDLFPPMRAEEFSALKADINVNGQREPAWTYEGKVIDGRNRLKACEELGVPPKVREWDGVGSLTAFVVSLNMNRRHLSSGQRAMCAVDAQRRLAGEIAAWESERKRSARPKQGPEKREEGSSIQDDQTFQFVEKSDPKAAARNAAKEAAKMFRTNSQYVCDAKKVRDSSSSLADRVKAGTMTLSQATREVARREKRTHLKAKAAEVKADSSPGKPLWEVIEGDCLDVLRTVEPGSVRLVFADPPYNIGVDYGDHHDDDRPAAEFLAWSKSWVEAAAATLAPDGSMWVLINDEWADVFGCMLRDAGLHRRAWIKWYESFGVNNANNFNRCSRHLFYMVKSRDRFVFNADAVSRPSARQALGDKRADPGGKTWDDVWGINPAIPRLVGNAKERVVGFPTQLPLSLLTAVVGCASEPGDLVVDPFSGSGTTCTAATRLGRRSLGIEKSKEYADLSRERIAAGAITAPCPTRRTPTVSLRKDGQAATEGR